MEFTLTMSAVVAIIMGLAQAIKLATGLNPKFVPVLDLLLGVALMYLYSFIEGLTLPHIIFYGLVAGLSACGLFSAGKNVLEGVHVK